jgi:tetratricopeptide (TPR) repeat protein
VFAALALVFMLGVLVGVALSFTVPSASLFAADRQRAALLADTGTSLEAAAAYADDGDPALAPVGALASALLLEEHGGGAADMKHADGLLRSTLSFVRLAPEALYARALLRRRGVEDNALGEDLDKHAEERMKNPWWLLAKATRAVDEGKLADAHAFAQKAALGEEAPLDAQVVLARISLARGNADDARAVTERALHGAPDLATASMLGIVAAVGDDARDDSPEKRAIKLKKVRARAGPRRDGPPKPGEAHKDDEAALLSLWRTAQEDDAIERIDNFDERDQPLEAFVLEAMAAGRGDDELAAEMKKRVLAAIPDRPLVAALQAELSIVDGDPASAEEAVQAGLDKAPGDPALVLDRARLKALTTLSDDEIRKHASGFARTISVDGIALPFGKIVFAPLSQTVPLRIEPDAMALPEAAFAQVMRGVGATASTADSKKLEAAVLVHKGEVALERGDVAGASTAVAQGKEKFVGDAEVLLLDARVRVRQADRAGAKDAIDQALEAAPNDPHVLLEAARLDYDNEAFIPARKALAKLKQLGIKSPAALALDAMLAARSGDAKDAQQSLAEAQSIGAGDVEILRANVLLLRDGKDLEALRQAASKLYDVDKLRAGDPILRAWEADAAARAGDAARASAVLQEVIAARPNLADAYLLLGSLEQRTDPAAASANFLLAMQKAPKTPVAAEAARRRALVGGRPVPTPGKLLPRKKPR